MARLHSWVNLHAPEAVLPQIVSGEGVYLTDALGKRYIDGSGGPALSSLGHRHPEVVEAIKTQFDAVEFGYASQFSSEAIDALAELIVEQCGGALRRVSFVSGGSEAVETAIKVTAQFHVANGAPTRTRFIARRQSWHGYTLGALSLSGHPSRRRYYEPLLMPVSHISPANDYRPPAGVDSDSCIAWYAEELDKEICRIGPENVAAFIFEPVVGAAGGAVPAPAGYSAAMRKVCDRYGVLLIADEVMCGVGRCGTWRALAADGVEPDIMVIAKGLGGGYIPLGAAVYSEAIYRTIADAHGGVASVHTYSGHTAACAAGLAVQRVILRDKLVEKVERDGIYLRDRLVEEFANLPYVGDIRGRGFFQAIEIVQDRDTKAPFDPKLQLHKLILQQAFGNGLICYPSGGTVDGTNGDHVLLAPPYIASRGELDDIVDRLGATVRQVMSAVGRA